MKGDFWWGDSVLTYQQFVELPSPRALSDTVYCESTRFLWLKLKTKPFTEKCVWGVNSGTAVNMDGEYS